MKQDACSTLSVVALWKAAAFQKAWTTPTPSPGSSYYIITHYRSPIDNVRFVTLLRGVPCFKCRHLNIVYSGHDNAILTVFFPWCLKKKLNTVYFPVIPFAVDEDRHNRSNERRCSVSSFPLSRSKKSKEDAGKISLSFQLNQPTLKVNRSLSVCSCSLQTHSKISLVWHCWEWRIY